METIPCQIHR